MPKQVRKKIPPRPSQKLDQFPSRLSNSLYLLHFEANLTSSRNRSLEKRKGLLAKAKEAHGRKTKRRLALRRKLERRVVLCRIRRENNKSSPLTVNQTSKTRREGPVIIHLVSESEDTDIEESQSEEYGSKNEERGKENAGSILVGAKKTRKTPNIAGNWSQAHSPQGSGKTADDEEKEKDRSDSIRKYTAKTKSLPLNKDIYEENEGDATAFRDGKNQESEEGDERKEEKGICFPLSKYIENSLNLPIAKGTAPGPKLGRDLVLELHRLEERTISTSKNSKQTPHCTNYHSNVIQRGQRYIRTKNITPKIQKEKGNIISSSIPALKIKSISRDEDIMTLGVKRRKNGMPRIPEDEEDSESEEGESAIITAQPHSTPSKNTSPAHASMALEHKRKLNTMPSTAQEQESKGQPNYVSSPSPPLLDGSRFKRQKTAPVDSWDEVNKDIDGVPRVESTSWLIPESVTDHLLPREIIRTKSPKSFADLPGLIIRQILDTVCEQEDGKLLSSICFGLTCKLHWGFFKARWCPPGSDMIYEGYLPKEDQALLAPFLQSWVPERYRMMSGKGGKGGPSLIPMFLSKNQYEEGYTREEERLEKRYVACLSILDATNLDGMQLNSSRGLHAIIDNTIDLPSPYGMGHSWYDASASEYLFLVEKWEYSTLNGDGPGFKAICESWYTFQDTCLWDWVNGKNFNQFREEWMDDEGMKGRQKVKQTLLKFDKKVKQFEASNRDSEDTIIPNQDYLRRLHEIKIACCYECGAER
ncbi:uncharacterized protein EAE97_008040 [Botrytis byssoidea]|uniref:Uncharacterized protein n=1 Tax=Botrytis byssoidea TaxID=139641 RepID=A0A9P5IBE7_9HELO|nr:uncharacterized protein EAE97_008040 [Botrytis byssoidea]KAF7936674.1 hypothetical protein EAE97_008040 [Botrytis byssoidea]